MKAVKAVIFCFFGVASLNTAADLDDEFINRLQAVSHQIVDDDPDFYEKAKQLAETSQTKYDFIHTLITALEAREIRPFDAASLLNIARCSLECAYMELSRIRYGLGD